MRQVNGSRQSKKCDQIRKETKHTIEATFVTLRFDLEVTMKIFSQSHVRVPSYYDGQAMKVAHRA